MLAYHVSNIGLVSKIYKRTLSKLKSKTRDFPAGAVIKNPRANAGDTGSSPGPGGSHRPRSN